MEQLSGKCCVDESTDILIQAQSYLLTAAHDFERRKCFTAEKIISILRMSIEKFFIGFFICNHHSPVNHSMNDLVASFKLFRHLDEQLERDLLEIDSMQADYQPELQAGETIESEYIERLIDTAQRVSQMVIRQLDCRD